MVTILSKTCQACGSTFRFHVGGSLDPLAAEHCPACNKKRRGRVSAERYAIAHPDRIKAKNARRPKTGGKPGTKPKEALVWLEGVLHKICGHCHVPKPVATAFVSSTRTPDGFQNWCKSCKAQGLRISRTTNPDKTREQRRGTYVRTQAKCLQRSRDQYAQQALDPEFRKTNVQRVATWRKQNPLKKKLADMRRDARKAGLPDTMTHEQVVFLYQYWHFACAICGQEEGLFGVKLVLDHWVALADPHCPGTVVTNMILMCNGPGSCNTSKIGKDPVVWLTQRYGPRKAAAIMKKITTYFALVAAREATVQSA